MNTTSPHKTDGSQADLPLFHSDRAGVNVQNLINLLQGTPRWLLASEILSQWRRPCTDHGRRELRSLAEAAGGAVLSGQQGYKWIGHATFEERQHASDWLISQGKKMIQRGIAQRRMAHQLAG